jgi:hypothetical protein
MIRTFAGAVRVPLQYGEDGAAALADEANVPVGSIRPVPLAS